MKSIDLNDVVKYVEDNIGVFHEKRISSLDTLSLNKVIKRKNQYLFRAKHVLTSEEIVKGLVNAHISSNEETIFGDWLEGLAIFINQKVYRGWKSGIKGIDLEFDHNETRYIVNIKSGPNWGNSSQISKMKSDFMTAQRTLRTSNSKMKVICVNGCCYGVDKNPDKGNYFKYCGQKFWEFISGDKSLYVDIVEPLGHKAKEKNDEFIEAYSRGINRFTYEFGKLFCNNDGAIDWNKLVEFNSKEASAIVKN